MSVTSPGPLSLVRFVSVDHMMSIVREIGPDHPVTELWRVITGKAAGRRDARQITLFDSVGFAIEDFSALRYIHDQLARAGHFAELDLVADPDDPRDLYGMLRRAGVKAAA